LKKHKVYVHNFEETIEIPLGEFDIVDKAKDAILAFHQNGPFPVIFGDGLFLGAHTFEDLLRGARIKIENSEGERLLCLA